MNFQLKLLAVFTLMTLVFFSCTKDEDPEPEVTCPTGFVLDSLGDCVAIDPCDTVTCGVNAVCDAGSCECVYGYEQDANGDCNTTWATKFATGSNAPATDTVYGDNGAFAQTYNMVITVTDSVNLSTTNLGGFGTSNVIDMEATSSYDLLINDTDVTGRVFNGTGRINSNQITLNYTISYNDSTVDTCETVIVL